METKQILNTLPQLSITDCLKIAEAALEIIHQKQNNLTEEEQKRALAAAAKTAIQDYAPGSQLLVFSEIEGEEFYDYSNTDI
ncbi:hypothetical protein IQ276_015765 [Desmonostoc muscorum LEGE 12446]|uniref:Uncharacterized protein n=1 Tax=Desmonostoc muscorum LEGE 12446 TaxID=1828758 RepID=A0A8J6ZX47_DESMC|nr:hypothetical protein [Desmonostoc muscorum]MCF2147852.1 hypothetical protein [Desmonostoc muscorum LEGE 12446]